MRPTAIMFRILAIAFAPFAIFQLFGPLNEFCRWLGVAVTPNLSYTNPSTAVVFFDVARQLTIGLALLAVPLILWVAAEWVPPPVRWERAATSLTDWLYRVFCVHRRD